MSSGLCFQEDWEQGWVLGGSFRFNERGWFLIKRGGAAQRLRGLDRATTSECLLPLGAEGGGVGVRRWSWVGALRLGPPTARGVEQQAGIAGALRRWYGMDGKEC